LRGVAKYINPDNLVINDMACNRFVYIDSLQNFG